MADGGAAASGKPNWLILGGLGFIGRNLVKYLVDNALAGQIRIADKRAPFMAFLSPDHKAAIMGQPDIVEWVQVDMSDDDMVEKAFADPRAGGSWEYVVNLVAETAHGKKDEFYEKGVASAAKAAAAAARLGSVKKFIQVSTAAIYKPDKSSKGTAEGGKVDPWNTVAAYCLRAEEAARSVPGLPVVVLRPALTYGQGDHASLMPRCVIAATYKAVGDKMEFLWDGDLRVATVHVFDVVRAIYFAARKADAGCVFNLADKGATDQAKIAAAISAAFGVETGFVGTIKSNLAALKLDAVVDAANESHLSPWLALLKKHAIANTPLSPYLHKSLLAHNHLCIDGSAIEAIGFKYAVPELTADTLKEPVQQAIAQGIFPPVL